MSKFELAVELRKAFAAGHNVLDILRNENRSVKDNIDMIEISYDLQSGTYIKYLQKNWDNHKEHNDELCSLLAPYVSDEITFLDAGAGELTHLSLCFENPSIKARRVLACDISWSRLWVGRDFWHERIGPGGPALVPFVADFKELPLARKSIDVVCTRHALEPNGKELKECLSSLFRVAKRHVILFEPHYEIADREAQARMDRHGYIRDVEAVARSLGGEIIQITPFKTNINPLNPISCFVIEPPDLEPDPDDFGFGDEVFTVPGTEIPLVYKRNFMASPDTGFVFPILDDIPVLVGKSAFLATKFVD